MIYIFKIKMTDIFGGNGKYGDLDLNGNKIINCLDPDEDHHVSTKQYVDTKINELNMMV